MVTALDLPQDLVDDIRQRAAQEGRGMDETAAELLRTGLAVSTGTTTISPDPRMLEQRKAIVQKFLSGEWSAEFREFEDGRAADRSSAQDRNRTWRG